MVKHRISYNDDFYKLVAGQLALIDDQGGIEIEGGKPTIWLTPEESSKHNLEEDDTFQLGGDQQIYKVKVFKPKAIEKRVELQDDKYWGIHSPESGEVITTKPIIEWGEHLTGGGTYTPEQPISQDIKELMKSEGVKADGDKPPLGLLPWDSMSEIAKAFDYGAKKYATYNFTKGIKYMRLISAAGRHLWQYAWVEKKDPETGLSHLAHAGACVCMALWMENNRPDLDDTYVAEKGKQ